MDVWITQLKSQLEEIPDTAATQRKRNKLRNQIRHTYERHMYDRIKMTTGKIKPHTSSQLEIQVGDTSKIIKDPDEIAKHF